VEFEEFDARLDELVVPVRVARPPEIYHYTTSRGFEGILQTGELWATHFLDTNDTSELRYADDEVRAVVTRHARTARPLGRRLLNRFLIDYQTNSLSRKFDAYLTCFSKNERLLSQWTRYAEDGWGYVLGFDPRGPVTAENVANPDFAIELFEAEYDLKVLVDEFDSVISGMLSFVESAEVSKVMTQQFESQFLVGMLRSAAYVCAKAKHTDFNHEQEFRLLAFPLPNRSVDVLERDVRGTRKRYVRLRIAAADEMPLTRVTIGPSWVAHGRAKNELHRVKGMLRERGASEFGCRVGVCESPYRGALK
jgi:hypothetical protein